MKDKQRGHVYAVGSVEGGRARSRFIVDRLFGKKEPAITYCDSRQNKTFLWCVKQAPLGGWYHEWSVVHRTKRREKGS